MNVLFSQFYDGVNKGLLLGKHALELMALEFMLQLIIYKSLSHKFAYNDFDLGLLLQETVIFTYLDLIILNELKQLCFMRALFDDRPKGLVKPLALPLEFFWSHLLIRVEKLSNLRISEIL